MLQYERKGQTVATFKPSLPMLNKFNQGMYNHIHPRREPVGSIKGEEREEEKKRRGRRQKIKEGMRQCKLI